MPKFTHSSWGMLPFLLTVACVLSLSLPARAYDAMVDGVAYNWNDDGTATVTYTARNTANYSGITEVNIPVEVTYDGTTRQVTAIGENAFIYCYSLASVTLPPTIKRIDQSAFRACQSLTTIALPASLESIGMWAFYNCNHLESITIPASVTSIHEEAFRSCTAVKSISVVEGNTAYDSRGGCNAIIETATGTLIIGCPATVIPQGVTALGSTAFFGMQDLTAITIPGTVRSIGLQTFYNTGLTQLELPASVNAIGSYAFANCLSLETITVAQGNTAYDSRSGCNAIIETATGKLITACKNTVIPNGVAIIGESAFYGTPITSVTIPSTVHTIERQAFYACRYLTSLTIPASVTSIGANAFYVLSALETLEVAEGNPIFDSREGCNAIIVTASDSLITGCKSTVIPDGVRAIGDYAFYALPITTITLPASVTHLGNMAFGFCNLTDIYSHIPRPDAVTCSNDNPFYGVNANTCVLHVPNGTESLYMLRSPWSAFVNIVPLTKTGDVNGDEYVDVADVNTLINIVLGKDDVDKYEGRANVNGDGYVDVADVNALINIVLGKSIPTVTCIEVERGPDGQVYQVRGRCNNIYNTHYGNWYLTDETGTIVIYGTLDSNGNYNFENMNIEEGDIVTVRGPKTTYNGTTELVDVTVIKVEKSPLRMVSWSTDDFLNAAGEDVAITLHSEGGLPVRVQIEAAEGTGDWLSVVSNTGGTDPVITLHADANESDAVREASLTFSVTDAQGQDFHIYNYVRQWGQAKTATVAEFIEGDGGQYHLTGIISRVEYWSNGTSLRYFYIKDYTGELQIASGNEVYTSHGMKPGDIVTLVGHKGVFFGVPRLVEPTCKMHKQVEAVTIDEFIAKEDNDDAYYMISGTVDNIANAKYGNLYITQGDSRLYVYGLSAGWGYDGWYQNYVTEADIATGDTITVIGYKKTYGTTPELYKGICFSHEKPQQ